MEVSFPAITIGLALSEIEIWSSMIWQGVIIPFAVNVKETDPVAPEGGTNEAFMVFAFGKNVPPLLEVHVPPVAPPVTDPIKEMACPEHETISAFAETIAA